VWNVKTKLISVTVGATGTIANSLRQYLSNVPGKHAIEELQKTATLGKGSADVTVQNIFSLGNNMTCSINCKYRTAATLYTVETWLFQVYRCK
jgi:uncharacterized protein YycO